MLWLWCGPAATALIQPLAWEIPYAASAALKRKKKKKTFTKKIRLKKDKNIENKASDKRGDKRQESKKRETG